MQSRKQFLFGSALLVLVVAVVSVFWALSGDPRPDEVSGETPAAGSDLAQASIPADAVEPIPITIYLSPTCGCCTGWVEHIARHGFELTLDYREDMAAIKTEYGVRPEHSSCHTAVVNGYVIEGHVPGEVMREFLAEAPAVKGLTVPGMPIGSPGMESGDTVEPYDVLTFTSDGRTRVYSREGRN